MPKVLIAFYSVEIFKIVLHRKFVNCYEQKMNKNKLSSKGMLSVLWDSHFSEKHFG
jgi:hypothetical protein